MQSKLVQVGRTEIEIGFLAEIWLLSPIIPKLVWIWKKYEY